MNSFKIRIFSSLLFLGALAAGFYFKSNENSFDKIKSEYSQCLEKINNFSEKEIFNRYIRVRAQTLEYGDGVKYLIPDECKKKRVGRSCEIYNQFDQAEKKCLNGSRKQCLAAIFYASKIKADSFLLKKKACELGDENLCYFIAFREYSDSTAMTFQRICNNGRNDACLYLGVMKWNSDRNQAFELLKKAGPKNYHEVVIFLERLGAFDDQIMWLQYVCEKGNSNFCFSLRELSREKRIQNFVQNGCFLSVYEDQLDI